MSFSTFLSFCPKHSKNGTTWLGRTLCWLITEPRYDSIRVWKRTFYAQWWYSKQHFLHWMYVNKSEWANSMGLVPKPDSSHGFPYKETPSRYAQIAEDNFNSDGYVGWYTYLWVAAATVWSAYLYFWPRRWVTSSDFLSEDNLYRQLWVDSFMSTNYDQSFAYWWNVWQWNLMPHLYEWNKRHRHYQFPPDSRVESVVLTMNRMNTFHDHYWKGVGKYQDTMR